VPKLGFGSKHGTNKIKVLRRTIGAPGNRKICDGAVVGTD
jgi:hypothetical protein